MDWSVERLSIQRCNLLSILLTICVCSFPNFVAPSTSLPNGHRLYTVEEEQPAGNLVANLSRDLRMDLKYSRDVISTISYVLLSETPPTTGWFALSPTGLITTRNVIDRDVTCRQKAVCDVIMQVSLAPAQYFDVYDINISVTDVNDRAPTFPQSRVNLTIPESSPVGTRFVLPSAVDTDSPSNARTDYRLTTQSAGNFRLNRINNFLLDVVELRLELLRVLDREERDRYEMTIESFDIDRLDLFSTLVIDVSVLDANDNRPQFEHVTYSVSVLETTPVGSVVARVSAIDRDAGLNGRVRYKMTSRSQALYGDRYSILADTGEVVLLKSFEYAFQAYYSISIAAEDYGDVPSTSVASLFMTVVDVNDHSPEITFDPIGSEPSESRDGSTEGLFSVSRRSLSGTMVARVTVRDLDDMYHAQVSCSLGVNSAASSDIKCALNDVTCASDDRSTNDYFQLAQIFDGEYKLVTSQSLDDTTYSKLELFVSCSDSGSPVLTSTRNFTVNLFDVGGLPVFARDVYRASLLSNSLLNAVILQVHAFAGNTSRDKIIYSLEDLEILDSLRIDPATGSISNIVAFDEKMTRQFMFNVTATVIGDSSRHSSVEVFITVPAGSTATNLPLFFKCVYAFEVHELARPATSVGHVLAMVDKYPYSFYEFYISPPSRSFRVDPKTGVIYSRTTLDRETQDRYELLVKVRAIAEPALQADWKDGDGVETRRLQRVVDSEDDLKIVFVDNDVEKSFNHEIKNNRHSSTADGDRITRSREVKNCEQFISSQSDDDDISDDGKFSDVAIVTIEILDANDNAPVVLFPPNGDGQVSVPSDLSPGRLVTRIVATDRDLGDNSLLSYGLVDSNGTRYFDLNETTGEVRLLAVLTHCVNESFRLVLSVQDQGAPRRQMSLVMLIISIRDAFLFPVDDHTVSSPNQWFTNLSAGAKAVSVAILATICVTVILLIVIAIFLVCRRRHHGRRKEATSPLSFDSIPLSMFEMSVSELGKRSPTSTYRGTSLQQTDIDSLVLDVPRSLVSKPDSLTLTKVKYVLFILIRMSV